MKVIVSNNVIMSAYKIVSHLKNKTGCDYNTCVKYSTKMLSFLKQELEKITINNGGYLANKYYCWWSDGNSGWAIVYYLYVLPRQETVLIYDVKCNSVENLKENHMKRNESKGLVVESLENMVNTENKNTYEKVGDWDVVPEENPIGLFYPGVYKGLEDFKGLVRDVMYAYLKGDTYCVFRIPDTNKYLFSIMYPFNYFNPVKIKDIPKVLFNHFLRRHRNV